MNEIHSRFFNADAAATVKMLSRRCIMLAI